MIELNKITGINDMFIYYDNMKCQLITPAIRDELLLKIKEELEIADYIESVISSYMDAEKNRYDKIANIKINCIHTGDYVEDARLYGLLVKYQGRYEMLYEMHDKFSKKIEKYNKWMYRLKQWR